VLLDSVKGADMAKARRRFAPSAGFSCQITAGTSGLPGASFPGLCFLAWLSGGVGGGSDLIRQPDVHLFEGLSCV